MKTILMFLIMGVSYSQTMPTYTLPGSPSPASITPIAGHSITWDSNGVPVNAAKEPLITLGTTGQYYRGDKTWQSLPAGLSNITGLITQGSNITITGSGTSGSPYNIVSADYISAVTAPLSVTSGNLSILNYKSVQATTLTTNSAGVATWTFSPAFSGAPKITTTPIDNTANTAVDVKITSKSATSVTIQVSKIQPILGILNILGTTGITDVDIAAFAP